VTALFILAAALEFVAVEPEPVVFAGAPQPVRVAIRNTADQSIETNATSRLFQLSATAAVPVGEAQPWKTLRLLPGQTALEDLPASLPAVRSPTRFRIECPGIGRFTVTALPADALKRLAGEDAVGIFDPGNTLKPAFKAAGVEFADFETEPRDVKLALVAADKLPESVSDRARKGMAVVWFKSSRLPVAYAARLEAGTVIVAPPASIAALADSASAQAHLLRYAELALTPDVFADPTQ
jgi:hypothetical protein